MFNYKKISKIIRLKRGLEKIGFWGILMRTCLICVSMTPRLRCKKRIIFLNFIVVGIDSVS